MGKYNGAVITTAGQNVISQSISGTKLAWLTMKTSSIAIPAGTNIESLTTLSGIEQTSKITDASVYGNNVIQLSARFSNTNIATEYYIQTVGIYGQLTGGNETLIAVMTAVTPDEMPVYDPDAPSAFIFNAQITVQNAESVTMTVNDTGTATVADLNRKLDKTGDASDAKIGSSTASTAAYPIPAANDTFKVILGTIITFFTDIKAAYTNVSISGKKITFTTAAGGTKQITTQDTTYSAGSGLSLSGTTFNHSNRVTAGTAGQSSASSGRSTLAVPYVTYDAQGHVTAAGTHTHTINTFAAASSTTAAGAAGLVPAPAASNFNNRALMYLRSDGGWQFLPLQNNASTTASYYALDARMGKTLNDRITEVVNRCNYTSGNGTLNTTYVNSNGFITYAKQRCYDKYITTVTFDINFKGSYSSNNVAKIGSGLPVPIISGVVFICPGESYEGSAHYGYVLIDNSGILEPWYCSTVTGHWFGSMTYISN